MLSDYMSKNHFNFRVDSKVRHGFGVKTLVNFSILCLSDLGAMIRLRSFPLYLRLTGQRVA